MHRGNRNRRCAGAIVSELRRGWRTIAAYRNGMPYGEPYRTAGPVAFAAGKAQVVFGVRHTPAGPGKMLAGTIERARLYDRALSAEEITTGSDLAVTGTMIREQLSGELQTRFDRLQAEVARLTEKIAVLQPPQVYAIKPRQPEPTHLLAQAIRHNRRRLSRRAGSAP